MWKDAKYVLTGVTPLIMHNGQTADPLNFYAKALKQVTSKRTKTDADIEEMARIEFVASLYFDKTLGPVLPQKVLEATILNGAKKSKEGMLAKSGMYCQHPAKLLFDGPREPDAMWKAETFRFSELVNVQRSKVVRTRAIFNEWSAEIVVSYEDSVVNKTRVDEWLTTAGTLVGMCDWRPRYGRFAVKIL